MWGIMNIDEVTEVVLPLYKNFLDWLFVFDSHWLILCRSNTTVIFLIKLN